MRLRAEAVSSEAFEPFGRILSTTTGVAKAVNEGRGRRRDLTQLAAGHGWVTLATYHLDASAWPISVSQFERHLADQVFLPLDRSSALIVVAPSGPDGQPVAREARPFTLGPDDPFLYRAGTWHAPLFALGRPGRFLMAMAETGGPEDCQTVDISPSLIVDGPSPDPRIG